MPTLHVHTDESGDLNFKPSGSPRYYFAVVWTREPAGLAGELRTKRFSFLRAGLDIPRFHASADTPQTRTDVFQTIASCPDWKFSGLVIPKDKLWAMYRKPADFYARFLKAALCFVFRGSLVTNVDRVLVYTDTLPNMQASKAAVEKAIKTACAAELKSKQIRYSVYHHPSASNKWLQVADYCCYALQRKHDWGDTKFYDMVKAHCQAPELELWK